MLAREPVFYGQFVIIYQFFAIDHEIFRDCVNIGTTEINRVHSPHVVFITFKFGKCCFHNTFRRVVVRRNISEKINECPGTGHSNRDSDQEAKHQPQRRKFETFPIITDNLALISFKMFFNFLNKNPFHQDVGWIAFIPAI
ncbi:hypothetical protein LF95_04065 [Thalassospira sp. TSL5-1]|nr:hypothetical protein LF95_04065 [Thalassospira sp. TSL5-1]